MQAQADGLVGTLRAFIDQPDYPTLVLGGDDASMVFPAHTLRNFDSQDDDNYYLVFADKCESAGKYVDGIFATLDTQREVFNTELAARNMPPWPAWPLEAQDSRYPPARRLRAMIEYLGEQMPPGNLVWGLLPSALADFEGYKALITPLLALQRVEPWMDRHRFVVRDREPPTLIPELFQAKNDRILVMEIDFSNEATERSLNATALDKSLPHDTRMFAFFQLAAIDFAYKRLPEALEKFGHCFNYFKSKGNMPLASLCLKSAGDIMTQAGRPKDALKFFQQSIAVSMDDKNLATLQQGLFSAGSTSMDLGNAVDAEGYFKHASAVSGKLNNPYTKCDAMEKQGQAQWQLGRFKQAEETWSAAKGLCKMFNYTERAHSILDQMIAMYRLSNMPREAAQCEREKAELIVAEKTQGV